MKLRFRQITIMLTVLMAVLLLSLPASAAYNVKQIFVRFSATAGETLTTGQVVMLKDSDGYAYKADANDAALRPAIGIIGKGGASGATVEIITIGILSGWSSLSEGAPGYLSETAAAVTQSSPAYSQQVGQAITSTTYLFNFQNYFDSSSLTVLGTLSGATPLVFEGTTADDYETTIAVTDPTADRTVTLADASGTVMLSSLATNAPDAANAVTGASNGLVFEGATADEYETTLTPVDPTADRTVTIPNATFTLSGIRYYDAGTTSTSGNTDRGTTGLFYSGSVTVSSGTNVVVSGFSPAFTNTSNYQCVISAQSPNPAMNVAWKCAKTSTSSITISTTTTNAVTDTINYVLMGY